MAPGVLRAACTEIGLLSPAVNNDPIGVIQVRDQGGCVDQWLVRHWGAFVILQVISKAVVAAAYRINAHTTDSVLTPAEALHRPSCAPPGLHAPWQLPQMRIHLLD